VAFKCPAKGGFRIGMPHKRLQLFPHTSNVGNRMGLGGDGVARQFEIVNFVILSLLNLGLLG
jgi:hypothetical protein